MATLDVKIPDPFIQTAYLHDKEENLLHFTGFRIRVIGAGNLDLTLFDMDSIKLQNLVPIALQTTNEDQPFRLANFTSQRIMLKLGTNVIDEYFEITKLVGFSKPVWTEYPR